MFVILLDLHFSQYLETFWYNGGNYPNSHSHFLRVIFLCGTCIQSGVDRWCRHRPWTFFVVGYSRDAGTFAVASKNTSRTRFPLVDFLRDILHKRSTQSESLTWFTVVRIWATQLYNQVRDRTWKLKQGTPPTAVVYRLLQSYYKSIFPCNVFYGGMTLEFVVTVPTALVNFSKVF